MSPKAQVGVPYSPHGVRVPLKKIAFCNIQLKENTHTHMEVPKNARFPVRNRTLTLTLDF